MRKPLRLTPVADGEWVQPRRRGYLLGCCDCGLVHRINFRLLRNGRGASLQFQAFREVAATKEVRRRRRIRVKL